MKRVVDTNPVVNACIIPDYKTKVIDYFQNSDSLMILTIYNEIKDKLLMLHTCLLGLERFTAIKGNQKLLLPMFKDIKEGSEQIYNFIKKSKDKNLIPLLQKLQISVGILLTEIKKIQVHPQNDLAKNKIIQANEKVLSSKLPKIKKNDLNHLYLMYDYTQNFASEISFFTEDKEDYLNNKEKIENVLKDIKIKHFSKY